MTHNHVYKWNWDRLRKEQRIQITANLQEAEEGNDTWTSLLHNTEKIVKNNRILGKVENRWDQLLRLKQTL